MKIGVTADTHSKGIPDEVLKAFGDVDLIIHAGDFCDMADYKALAEIKEVRGVHGNMDGPDILKKLPRRDILDCNGVRIGIYHGEGAPAGLLDKVREEFKKDKVDVVVFGHSHHPMNEKIGGVLYFNPGSPNDDVFAPYKSYGILEVTPKGVQGRIIKVK